MCSTHEVLCALFSQFYPRWIMPNDKLAIQGLDIMTYIGTSPQFRDIGEGGIAPKYTTKIKNGKVTFEEIK